MEIGTEETEEAFDALPEGKVSFSEEVQLVLDEVFPSDEPLEQADFNVVDYINNIFPTEQSLANIDEVVVQVETKIGQLNKDVKSAVRQQTSAGAIGQIALEEAQMAIRELFAKIKNIKDRAEQSEQMVEEITRDIKQLDIAKRNLTQAITTHNHLHMLISGVDTLATLTRKREYGEAAGLLAGVLNVMEQFDNYTSIDTVRDLSKKVRDLKQELTRLVLHEFEAAFGSTGGGGGVGGKNSINPVLLRQACEVADVLEPTVRRELLQKFISNQLSEYLVLFDASQDEAWLDKIDRRYAKVKEILVNFEENFAPIFPKHWEVSERIAVEFCRITSRELNSIMRQRSKEIDVKLLLFAIQRTTNFENLLARRLSGVTLRENKKFEGGKDKTKKNNNAAAAETSNKPPQNNTNPFLQDENGTEIAQEEESSEDSKPPDEDSSPFLRLISSSFEPFLFIYIESQDRNLSELMSRFEAEFRAQVAEMRSGKTAASCDGGGVLASCADLFVYYKKCMTQCTQLSTAEPLVALAGVFQKHLREYANRVLLANLPKRGGSVAPSTGNINPIAIVMQLKDGGKDSASAGNERLSDGELALACSILTTADYCLDTVHQLEEKLREKVDAAFRERVNLQDDKNAFASVITGCIQLLVQDLQHACEVALQDMPKQSWTALERVGDQSAYVTAIEAAVKRSVPAIRSNLSSARKYFTQFCIKFANSFVPRFVSHLCRCKPIGTVGAEQLLLDAHSVKTLLLDLPSIGSKVARKAPSSYTKIVVKGMTRAEMLLKVVMTPHEPTPVFVASCVRLLQDVDLDTIQKVVDMKGLRRIEQTPIVEAFRRHMQIDLESAQAVSPSSGARIPANSQVDSDSTFRIRKLEKLIKKRL